MIMVPETEKNILDWRNQSNCQLELNNYADDILNDEVRLYIVNQNVTYCFSDNMSFLPDESIVEKVIEKIKLFYNFVKAFHGCRPVALKSYYDHGLQGQSFDPIEKLFKKIFADFDEEILDKVIFDAKNRNYSEEGSIFFVCNDQELIEDCGHYLIQGSEYLQGLAARLMKIQSNGIDHRLRLRKYGVPTILEVNIPVSIIPYYQLKELAQTLIADWGNRLLDVRENYDDNMGFRIYEPITPSHIVNHYHPRNINDPHYYPSVYRSKKITCDMCLI